VRKTNAIPYVQSTDNLYSYAFDVKNISGSPFLVNRRVFAMPDTGTNTLADVAIYGLLS
jgi:hypothetical protein